MESDVFDHVLLHDCHRVRDGKWQNTSRGGRYLGMEEAARDSFTLPGILSFDPQG